MIYHLVVEFDGPYLCGAGADAGPWTYDEQKATCSACLRAALASHSAPPPEGLRCPCGGGTCVPIPTCPACGEQWIDDATGRAMDAATAPHVFEGRRAALAASRPQTEDVRPCVAAMTDEGFTYHCNRKQPHRYSHSDTAPDSTELARWCSCPECDHTP